MLEPLSVSIQASRRGKIIQGSSVIVFGAGTVGLLCAAMSKVAGATSVVIADIQPQKAGFALKHSFADHGIVVRAKRGHDIEEKLQIARETAVLARQTLGAAGVVDSDFDVVLECTVQVLKHAHRLRSMSVVPSCRALRSVLTLPARLRDQEVRL